MGQKGRKHAWIAAAIVGFAALALYWPSGSHAFVTFDDPLYLYENPAIADGLTTESVAWAFRSTELGNWHPLTWLSHLLDVSLFGLDAGAHHRVNAVLHAIAALLLFGWLRAATGRLGPALVVALLFAVHPLHVESVAWASERKDVLSVLFGHAAIWLYVRTKRIAPVALLHALSLMAKPTLVTLPLLLLVLDHWPLERFCRARVLEKWPLFLLSFGSAVTTFLVQRAGGAVRTLESFPLLDRLLNAVISLWTYPRQVLLPVDLAFFYPYPSFEGTTWVGVAISLALTLGACALAWRWRRCGAWFTAGWLWYLIALLPMIGIVQVGSQAHADRYAYVPLVGLYIATVWWVDGMLPDGRPLRVVPALGVLVVLAVLTVQQLATWKDSETLYRHALSVTERNYIAHDALGYYYRSVGRDAEAIEQYEAAIAIRPELATSLNNLGVLRVGQGHIDEGVELYRRAIASDPDYATAHNNLGIALAGAGDQELAIEHLSRALTLVPDNAEALYNLGLIHRARGEHEPMVALFARAIVLRPDWHDVAIEIAWVLATDRDDGNRDGSRAVALAEGAVQTAPDNLYWLNVLAAAYAEAGRYDDAIAVQARANDGLRATGRELPASARERLELYRSGRPYRS